MGYSWRICKQRTADVKEGEMYFAQFDHPVWRQPVLIKREVLVLNNANHDTSSFVSKEPAHLATERSNSDSYPSLKGPSIGPGEDSLGPNMIGIVS